MRSRVIYSFILPGLLLPALASAATTITLTAGWNLVGNGDPTAIEVGTRLSDATKINTVWKWNKAGKWAFYTPSMTSVALASYAASKGYDVLTSIESKEGFWVNAVVATTLSDIYGTPPGTAAVILLESDLLQGWNLTGSADYKTPSGLNAALSTSLNEVGKTISTVWAWDAPNSRWKFYAPTLAAQGASALTDYITSKGYLPFTSALTATDGFWVNIGAVVVTPPAASASLHALTFTSAADWYMRVTKSTIAQNTPDANGTYRYSELHTARAGGGAPYSWGPGSSPKRGSDLHWNGLSWANCPINFENTQTVRDANGNSTYNYCNGVETGSSNRSAPADISGRPMIDVYNEASAAATTNLMIASATTVLGAATFPTGSLMYFSTGTPITEAVAYYPGTSNYVLLQDANLAAGISTACSANPTPSYSTTATLEGLIAVSKGTPCVYGVNNATGANGAALTSGTRNEGWGYTTLDMGIIGTAPTYSSVTSAASWYTTNTRFRVAFGAVNVANYYSCQESWGGSTRNCDFVGSGTYTIQTLGDAKTLSFSGLPTLASSLNYSRVFVERGGYVYYGYQSAPIAGKTARLNLTGLNALFSTLGLATVNPDAPVALSLASYAGTYGGTFAGSDSGTFSVTASPSGATSCSGTSVTNGAITCSFTLKPGAIDTTTATIELGVTGTGEVFSGSINYYTGVVSGNWVNSAAGMSGTFTGARL
jgi:hypothetical protein